MYGNKEEYLNIAKGLCREQIARITLSTMRSVSRWKNTGCPPAKLELLKMRVGEKNDNLSGN
jgi:hypothetical protein